MPRVGASAYSDSDGVVGAYGEVRSVTAPVLVSSVLAGVLGPWRVWDSGRALRGFGCSPGAGACGDAAESVWGASARRSGEDTLGMSFGVAAVARGGRFGRGAGFWPGVAARPATSVGRSVSTGAGRSPAGGPSAPDRAREGSGEDDECAGYDPPAHVRCSTSCTAPAAVCVPLGAGSPVGAGDEVSDASGTVAASGSWAGPP
ncbi:hypothetical protein [Streptomyces sp. NPDC051677]|uniref:hypothetical protein n=1 Tax=Streptomyces sp. NPDC051677 TaxID=3365669 RepID=UPI0037D8D98E